MTRVSLPERLGRLRRVERIGSGGFATVWRYYDDELECDVAVKALADIWAHRLDVRDRFLTEARMLRKADADRVVRVYDIGETEDGTPYFVMSYADLGTVADLIIADEPLTIAEVLDVIRQAGAGISVLHRRGIVHRDIKPQNLLLKNGGDGEVQVMVADLGVAKALAHSSALTQVVGTPAYMAPEQVLGTGVDERADVHALAAVAYVLLTGRPVRDDTLNGLLTASLPPRPSSVARVPRAFDAPVLKALEPDRENRYRSVEAFLTALTEAEASASAPVEPTTIRQDAVRTSAYPAVATPADEQDALATSAYPAVASPKDSEDSLETSSYPVVAKTQDPQDLFATSAYPAVAKSPTSVAERVAVPATARAAVATPASEPSDSVDPAGRTPNRAFVTAFLFLVILGATFLAGWLLTKFFFLA